MAQMVSWPTLTDSPGDPSLGTVINHAWEDAVKTSIEDQVHNTTYTTVKPKDIIGEVEDIKAAKAAGSWSSLKDSMDGVIDFTDGSLIVPASVIDTTALKAAINGKNLVMNGNFLMWLQSNKASYWGALTGAARSTTTYKVGPASLELTRSGSDLYYPQDIIDDLSLMANYFQGRTIGYGCWIKANTANTARLQIADGVGYPTVSHSGSGAWEWVSGVATLSGSATKIQIRPNVVNNNDTCYFDGITVVDSSVAPDRFIPNEMAYGSLYFPFPGALSIGDHQGSYVFARPAIVKDIQAGSGVPHDGTPVVPSGGPISIDVKRWSGAAWESMFSAAKDIVGVGAYYGSVQPDGDFYKRCFHGASGVIGNLTKAILQLNITAVNSAEGFWFAVRCAQFVNPLEEFLAYNDVGYP